MKFLLWCILLVLCWPLALVALVLYPLVWLLLLPFRLVGIAVEGALELVWAIITLPARVLRALLGLSPKYVDQFNQEDDYHHQLQHEGPALVKLIPHELIQFGRRMQLSVHQPAVVFHTHLDGGQAIKTGRETCRSGT